MEPIPLNQEQDAQSRRLAISYCDLDDAAGFISSLGRLPPRQGGEFPDQIVAREAELLAFIVAYSRPFKNSWNPKGENTANRLSDDVLDVLSPEQKRYHEQILRLRDQHFAHSDPGPLKLFFRHEPDVGLVAEMQEARPGISADGVAAYLELALAVRAEIVSRLVAFGIARVERG